jgi:hypothetical protein
MVVLLPFCKKDLGHMPSMFRGRVPWFMPSTRLSDGQHTGREALGNLDHGACVCAESGPVQETRTILGPVHVGTQMKVPWSDTTDTFV